MITQFPQLALQSFYQWFDHYLLENGQAYTNYASALYPQTKSVPSGYNAYASPFRSFVWDSGVAGALIPDSVSGTFYPPMTMINSGSQNVYTGIYFPLVLSNDTGSAPLEIDFGTGCYVSLPSGGAAQSGNAIFFTGYTLQTTAIRVSGSGSNIYEDILVVNDGAPAINSISRGEFGMTVDFINGRYLINSNVMVMGISGAYSFKDLNLYFANDTQERMVFTNKYYLNSRFGNPITGIPPANEIVTPCIFISNVHAQNDPLAFGGLYNTKIRLTLNVLAETPTQLEGALALLIDSKNSVFPLLPESAWPLNSLGDYKSGYNYLATQAQYASGPNLFYIEQVRASKVSDFARIDQAIFLGLADITIAKARTIQ